MISEYNSALSGSVEYNLAAECLTYHKNNLRWDDLLEIFNRCGVSDLSQWVSRHPALIGHFETDKKIIEQTSSKLTNFIQYRNDAAHGLVDVEQILGFEELKDYADFIGCLCSSFDQLLNKHALKHLGDQEKASSVGLVSEVFHGNRTVCVMEGVALQVNDRLIVTNERTCFERIVVGLMMDNVASQQVVVAVPAEVGIKFDAVVPKRAKLYKVDSLAEPLVIANDGGR
jgi:hypothetical protein